MNKKIVPLFLIVFLALSMFLPILNTSAANLSTNIAYFCWGGFNADAEENYVYNKTRVYPYSINGQIYSQNIKINSGDDMAYGIYANISYPNSTLFLGDYYVWSGYQSNNINQALDFSIGNLLADGVINAEDMYYSGWSGPSDTDVYSFYFDVPAMSDGWTSRSYYGILVNYVNASTGIDDEVVFLFVIDDYWGTDTITLGGTVPPSFNVTWGDSDTLLTSLSEGNYTPTLTYFVALILSFIGIVVLMKAPQAWLPALFMLGIGFVLALAIWTSLFSLIGWSLIMIITPIFTYSGGKQK
jgi:hypothetical protein